MHLNKEIGRFEIGKQFDALLIDVYAKNGPIDEYDYSLAQNEEVLLEKVQRFVYMGDDRNIKEVYVKGREVKCPSMKV